MANLKAKILKHQRHELTECEIYRKLADMSDNEKNKKTLMAIADEELGHHNYWKSITGKDVAIKQWRVKLFVFLANLFGLSFSLRLLEKDEKQASAFYASVASEYPEALKMKAHEDEHESKLIDMLSDQRLIYAGAIVLGLNDALVELTGTLAGLTFAFGNSTLIAVTGLIMGVAASMSMAASGYLSSKEDDVGDANPITAAIYTGVAYIVAVILLVLPYFLVDDPYLALGVTLTVTVVIIASYTFYISVAKNIGFRRRFIEMAAISLGVAIISFGIGYFVKTYFGIEI